MYDFLKPNVTLGILMNLATTSGVPDPSHMSFRELKIAIAKADCIDRDSAEFKRAWIESESAINERILAYWVDKVGKSDPRVQKILEEEKLFLEVLKDPSSYRLTEKGDFIKQRANGN